MNKLLLSAILITAFTFSLYAENNESNNKSNNTKTDIESNSTDTASKSKLTQEQVKEQMEREKKYAKEQRFYQGDDYDLKAVEVNEESLKNIPVIEPEYDFDITDVYRDDL